MRILITGITGFIGGHLAEYLLAEGGHTIFGISRRSMWPTAWHHLSDRIPLRTTDLQSTGALEAIVSEVRPNWLFHLGGYSSNGRSFGESEKCWADNLTATRSLYEAVIHSDVRPRILFASSGLIYGDPDEPGQAFDERCVLKPASPYSASKAAADLLSYQVTRSPGLDVLRVRLFNQIGPRQSTEFAVANFARQIAAIEASQQPPVITTGDLSGQRDITDVRDIVAAFRLLMDKGTAGEAYNAGRGDTYRMQDLLDRLLKLTRTPVEVRQHLDPARKSDTAAARADVAKLRVLTGWRPRYDLDQTLADILADTRRQ